MFEEFEKCSALFNRTEIAEEREKRRRRRK